MHRIREKRRSLNLTMKDLAKIVGVSEGAISHYETGRREPDPDMLKKIACALGVSVDYLLGGDAHPSDMNVSADDEEGFITEIVDTLKLFPKEEKLFAIAMLNGIKQKLYNEGKLK